ncbi:MAG: hypothetical protein HFH45_02555 [Bacilli bacterium]|nr:hypothetical protein [Bacilli bacterium]
MNSLIGQYVNKLTINNINDFALKNNINLNENELNILLNVAKNHYREVLNGNDLEVINYLKDNLSKDNYDKIISLYNKYKNKYQGYL